MALIAGAGNPTGGSNPAGTSSSINYIGSHAYAYSGEISVNNNETNLLDFSSGPEYIVCKVQFNAAHSSGDDYVFKIYFNGEVVQRYVYAETVDRGVPDQPLYMVIPSYTHVLCSAQNITDTSANAQIVAITGRVYA
jgi:hypothetical protein